jgi:YVTN family beta-propeller protein
MMRGIGRQGLLAVGAFALASTATAARALPQRNASPQEGGSPYLLYVTNERVGEISIIDPASHRQINRIAVGKRPRGLVASPDHKLLYVAVSGSPIGGPGIDESSLPPPDQAADGIAVIDLASNKIIKTLRGVSDPEQLAISPDGARIYVSSENSGKLMVLDTAGNVVSTLSVGGEPEGIAVSRDGAVILATSEEDGSVAVIRGNKPEVVSRIKVGERPRNALFLQNGRAAIPGEFDSSVALVDYNQGKLIRKIQLASEDRPMGIAAAGAAMLVTTGRGGKLVKINPADSAKAKPIEAVALVGERPWGLTLSPDGKIAVTANGPGDDITMVDVATMRIMAKIPSTGGPWGVAAVPLVR